MSIADYLDESRVRLDIELRSRKHALQVVSEIIAEDSDSLAPKRVFDALFQRERLGCTALGDGVALPHARLAAATEAIAVFLRSAEPLDFEAADGAPVDMVFAVIFPEESDEETVYNLKALAGLFDDATLRHALAEAIDPAEVCAALIAASGE